MDVVESSKRRRFIAFFESLFLEHTHAATFQALSAIVLRENPAAELLVAACRLRGEFLERPEWWICRRGGQFFVPVAGEVLLGWSRALHICRASRADPAAAIETDWIDDWRSLPAADPLSWRFVDYLAWRIGQDAPPLHEEPSFGDAPWDDHRARRALGFDLRARTADLIGLRSLKEGTARPC